MGPCWKDEDYWCQTDYACYRSSTHPHESKEQLRISNLDTIKQRYKLYCDIKQGGCSVLPIVTEDGFVVDGMHRLCIMVHLGYDAVDVNKVEYEDCFSCKRFPRSCAIDLKHSVSVLRDRLQEMSEPIVFSDKWREFVEYV